MPTNAFSDDLLSAAAKFAQSGLRARLEDDEMVFLLHASTSLELLAKAFLASMHASLIAANDFDSLLHGVGEPKYARIPRERMRTITIGEALKRVGQILPELENLRESLQVLAAVRNGVVHAGQLSASTDDALLVPFLRASDIVLAATEGGDRDQLWGELLEVVDTHLSDFAAAAERIATEAVVAARFVFEQRYGTMDEQARKAAFSAIENSYDLTKYEEDVTECPACSRMALTSGSYRVEWEPDFDYADGESYVAGVYPIVTFTPGYLNCRICGLELDGDEQLIAAGVATSWHIDDADPADFRDDEYDDDRNWR